MLLPKFRLETAALRLERPLLIFLGQNDLYTRRWASEVSRGGHNPPGHAREPRRALLGPPPVPIFWYISHFDLENK